ncbi:MAG: response regulator transcription factor [Gammaproteobacteria bacterium]
MYRVMLVDDQEGMLLELRAIVEATGLASVVAAETNGSAALESAAMHKPDLVLLDVSLGEDSGVDLAAKLLDEFPQTRILAVSAHANPIYVRGMLKAGASGYLLKDNVHGEIGEAIAAVMSSSACMWVGDGLDQ